MVGGSTLHAAVAFHLGPNKVASIVRSATKQEQSPGSQRCGGRLQPFDLRSDKTTR